MGVGYLKNKAIFSIHFGVAQIPARMNPGSSELKIGVLLICGL